MGGCQCTEAKEVGIPERKPLEAAAFLQRSPHNNQLLVQNCNRDLASSMPSQHHMASKVKDNG
jgi:hypothetical protein